MADKSEILIKFGQNLRNIRESKKMTVQQLDALTAIDHSEISKLENGKKSLELMTILKLCKGLQIKADQLIPSTIIDMID
ncbi:helix-turn-helix domain-containing protein [Pedobacter africanus]|uniref:helix-turn-helix domain-containing protein n=1 Tax=Pedobacter africanus TaxID=151894 RepID=UPI00339587E7